MLELDDVVGRLNRLVQDGRHLGVVTVVDRDGAEYSLTATTVPDGELFLRMFREEVHHDGH